MSEMPSLDSVASRLSRRKLVQWTFAYLAGAWLFYQVISLVGQNFAWPPVVLRVLTVLLGVGFIAALVLAWYHGEKGEQRVVGMEIALFVVLAVLAGVGVTMVRGEPSQAAAAPAGVAKFAVSFPDDQRLVLGGAGTNLALSPDGTGIVYVGPSKGGIQLWQRPIGELKARPIPGSDGARNPVFSPDGSSVAFQSGIGLKTLSLQGGAPVTLVEGDVAGAMDWGSDGMLYFTTRAGALKRVSAAGGAAEAFVTQEPGTRNTWFDALPEGGLVLTVDRLDLGAASDIGVVSKDGGDVRILFPGEMARYARSGHLVYTTPAGTLMAVPFNARRLEVTGPAVALLEGVDVNAVSASQFALSDNGTLVYIPGVARLSELVRVDRSGAVAQIDAGWTAPFVSMALSPDQARLALGIAEGTAAVGAPQDIWIKQLDRGPLSKVTFAGSTKGAPGSGQNAGPSWSPDGGSITFASAGRVWMARADGTGSARLLMDFNRSLGTSGLYATWSQDGAWLVASLGLGGGRDIVAWRSTEDSMPRRIVATPADEHSPRLSPDGRWLAYVSDESGRAEVYVRPFPDTDAGKWQLSTQGATAPLWAHSGRELFYRTSAAELVAVTVATSPTFRAGETRVLFSTADYDFTGEVPKYAVSRDGQRFILMRSVASAARPDLTLVQNFFADLKGRVGK